MFKAQKTELKNAAASFMAVVFIFLLWPVAVQAKGEPCYTTSRGCFDPIMADAIDSMGGAHTNLLYHLSRAEQSGRAECKRGYDSGGSIGYGPMQITIGGSLGTGNMDACPKGTQGLLAVWTPIPADNKNAWQCPDANVAAHDAVECALIYLKKNSTACKNFAATLCSYNIGGGWCSRKENSFSRYGYLNGDTHICHYSDRVCESLGTCGSVLNQDVTIPTDPVTGKPNIGRFSEEQLHGNGGSKRPPPNCADLEFMQAMTLAKRGMNVSSMLMADGVFSQHKMNSFASCIIEVVGYFDKIKLMLSSALGMLGAIILGLVAAVLNWACQYVVGAINSILAIVCLPMPKIGIPALSLPGIPSASCDGLSLLNLIQAQGTFTTNIPYSGATHGMSLGLDQLIKTQ